MLQPFVAEDITAEQTEEFIGTGDLAEDIGLTYT